MEYKFTSDNFEAEVLNSDIPVMVDFYADWCGPCKMMMPIVGEMAEKFDGKVKVGKVNVDEQQELAGKFNVMSIPSFVFVKDGKVAATKVGAMNRDAMEEQLNALL